MKEKRMEDKSRSDEMNVGRYLLAQQDIRFYRVLWYCN